MKKEELNKLFEIVVNNPFDYKVLSKYPKCLTIYRHALNYNQLNFCKTLGVNRWRLYEIEKGIIKKLEIKKAKNFMDCIKSAFKKRNVEEFKFVSIYSNYQDYQKKSIFDSKSASKARSFVKPESNFLRGINSNLQEKATNDFERKIENILQRLKLDFRVHYLIEGISKKVISDFVILKDNSPKIVIEVRQTNPKSKRRQYDLLKMHAIRLDHKMQNIKLRWPDIKTVAILSNKNTPIKTLSPYLRAEFLNTDQVLIDSNLEDLPKYINNTLKKPF